MSRMLLASLLCLVSLSAQAEFYRWTDAEGHARVSNVPPAGVRADGSLARNHHPYSIPAQHARMRERLAREADALAAAASTRGEPAVSMAPGAGPVVGDVATME
ncbi:MAG: DUF4124 domain-containing protein [Gammaproteobacteria bacterium]